MFQYLTLRGILAAMTALAMAMFIGPRMIAVLNRYQIGQQVRSDGPQSHLQKSGTPTMGGGLILVSMVFGTLLWADLSSRFIWVLVGVTSAFGGIGFYDDYLKLVVGNSKGLPARYKYLAQSVAALCAAFCLHALHQSAAETSMYVPFFKTVAVPMSTAGFVAFAYFVIVGTSNAVNLTDGLDGLAIMPAVMVAAALGVFAYATGQRQIRRLPADPVHHRCRRSADLLRDHGRFRPRIPLVQLLSGGSVHGRCRRIGHRRRARHRRGDRAPGDRARS